MAMLNFIWLDSNNLVLEKANMYKIYDCCRWKQNDHTLLWCILIAQRCTTMHIKAELLKVIYVALF